MDIEGYTFIGYLTANVTTHYPNLPQGGRFGSYVKKTAMYLHEACGAAVADRQAHEAWHGNTGLSKAMVGL